MLKTHKAWQEGLKKGKGVLAIMLVVAMSLTSCASTYKNVDAAEAQQLVHENSALIILDVRSQAEYDSGYIPNALLIPVDKLTDRLGELDKTKPILIYSQDGVRSARASQILVDSEFSRVYNLEGGIIAWQKAGAAINHPPIIRSLTAEPNKVTTSHNCTIECTAQDPEGDDLSYAWSSSGGSISGEGTTITWTAPDEADTYNIFVVVTDDRGGESKTSLSIKVAINHPPIIKKLVAKYPRLRPTHSTIIECTAQDPEGDELSYAWSASGGSISGEGTTITWTAPDKESSYNITVVVTDGGSGEASRTVPIKVGHG